MGITEQSHQLPGPRGVGNLYLRRRLPSIRRCSKVTSQSPTRATSIHPVEGGSANDYDYCLADPINCYDLDGQVAIVVVAAVVAGILIFQQVAFLVSAIKGRAPKRRVVSRTPVYRQAGRRVRTSGIDWSEMNRI